MLKLSQLRKTTRRGGASGMRVVFPHLLRDQTLAPRIELAVRYFESMTGRQRHEMDAEMVVQLFGDHKLAYCLVECLAAWYRYYPRGLADELDAMELAALAAQGIASPSDLRLWLYRLTNAMSHGFVGTPERAPFLQNAAGTLGLSGEQLEQLTTLDAPANAVLVRLGAVPTPDEVIARYNFDVVAALLANAKLVRISLTRRVPDSRMIAALCERTGIRSSSQGTTLVLHGRQDALNGWSRHGAKLAMLLTTLLAFGLPASTGEAVVATPDGGEWLFRLDTDALTFLGGDASGGAPAAAFGEVRDAWNAADGLAAAHLELRRAGGESGWRLRRGMDVLVGAEGVYPVVLTFVRASQSVPVVIAPTTSRGPQGLGCLAARRPLIGLLAAAAAREGIASEEALAGTALVIANEPLDAADLPDLLRRAIDFSERHVAATQLERALSEARRAGVLIEARVAAWLGCDEEQVAAHLAQPASRLARERAGVRYVEGFGLCSTGVLDRARKAVADVAEMRGTEPVGPAWTLRVLGRKLREVTGVSEGIECLIAYLGAA